VNRPTSSFIPRNSYNYTSRRCRIGDVDDPQTILKRNPIGVMATVAICIFAAILLYWNWRILAVLVGVAVVVGLVATFFGSSRDESPDRRVGDG